MGGMNITGERIFFIGIKGVAMTNLARIAQELGAYVSGCDVAEEFITDQMLADAGITVHTGFDPNILPKDTTLVVYAAGHGGQQNPVVLDAVSRKMRIMHQAVFIHELMGRFSNTIAVAGCHGKTTTSGLLAHALHHLHPETSHLVGVSACGSMPGGRYAGDDYFVFEADEYGMDPPRDTTPKFHLFFPTHAIITSIDHDHPDVYPSMSAVSRAFQTFAEHVIQKSSSIKHPRLVLCADDHQIQEGLMDVLGQDDFLSYGSLDAADVTYHAVRSDEHETSFTIRSSYFDIPDTEFTVSLFGEKNVANATGVITMLLACGFSIKDIRKALRGYCGPKRRMEQLAFERDVYLFDDYAHHPAEIDATISAMQSRFPNRKIIVIFQPHTYSRTRAFLPGFAESLAKADTALVLPVFASAREQGEEGGEDISIADYAQRHDMSMVVAVETLSALEHHLKGVIRSGDVVVLMGAGDVYTLAPRVQGVISQSVSTI